MQQIDDMQQTLTRITTFREKDLDTAHLRDQLTDIGQIQTIKSEVLRLLIKKLREKNIKPV